MVIEKKQLKVAMVAIAKDEGDYIDEWVDYHVKIGFDDIFVYSNNWRIGKFIPHVTEIPFDGEAKQLPAYTDWLANHSDGYDWAAFFDIDEFLNTHRGNVKDILDGYSRFPAVGVNWRIFGDSGLADVENGYYGCLSRFTKCAKDLNVHVKSFVNLALYPKPAKFSCNPHIPDYGILDMDGKSSNCAFTNPVSNPSMELNHYFCKTKGEFVRTKMTRGRSDCVDDGTPDHAKRNEKNFDEMNFNEVDNTEAFDYYLELSARQGVKNH